MTFGTTQQRLLNHNCENVFSQEEIARNAKCLDMHNLIILC